MVDKNTSRTWVPNVGDRVLVPWGLDEVEGEVQRTYQLGSTTRLVISLDIPDADETETVVLPADAVEPITADEAPQRGRWWQEAILTRAVAQAIAELTHIPSESLNVQRGRNVPDLIFDLPDGRFMVIEVKSGGVKPSSAMVRSGLSQLRHYLSEASGHRDRPALGLLLFLTEVPPRGLDQDVKATKDDRFRLAVDYWRGVKDNKRLKDAVANLLGASR